MTILGMWNVAELEDLLDAKDFDIAQIETARRGVNMPADWDSDWSAFKSRYATAKLIADVTITAAKANIAVRNSVIPANSEYNGVLRALTKEEGTLADTDFQGLYNRLTYALGHQLDFTAQPQPRQGTDTDINVLQAADNYVLKPLNNAAKSGKSTAEKWLPWAIGGGLAIVALRGRIF